MRRRTGSLLIATLIAMVFLMILASAIFAFAYTNYRTAEQERGLVRARAAAGSLLFSVGSFVCERWDGLVVGKKYTGNLEDEEADITAEITVEKKNDRLHILSCSASYGDWATEVRWLDIARRTRTDASGNPEEVYEWIWK